MLFSWQLQNGPQNFDFFSIAKGADYSIEVISIETYAPNLLDIIKFPRQCDQSSLNQTVIGDIRIYYGPKIV